MIKMGNRRSVLSRVDNNPLRSGQNALRGQVIVETELLILCMVYNINKLHNKIQSARCGMHLHIPKAA